MSFLTPQLVHRILRVKWYLRKRKETDVGVRWSIYDWIRGWLLCRTWKIQPFFERNIFIIYLIFQTFIFGFLSCHEGWIVYKIMKVLIKSWQGLEDKIPGSSKCVFFFASPTKKILPKGTQITKTYLEDPGNKNLPCHDFITKAKPPESLKPVYRWHP